MTYSPLDRPVRAEDLYRLAEAKVLSSKGLEAAFVRTGFTPARTSWKTFFDRIFLFLGSALVLSGIIYFFAYNWDKLGRFAKFGLIEGAILATVLLAWKKSTDSLTGQTSLLSAAVLVGPLLAVYGQVYQTGADAQGLFLIWILLIVGWTVIARFSPLWLFGLTLANVWLLLYWNQILKGRFELRDTTFLLVMAFFNTIILLIWEETALRGVQWLRPRWYPGIIATAAVFYLTLFSIWSVFERDGAGWFYLPVVGILLAYSYLRTRDLFILAISFLSIIITVTSFFVRTFDIDEGMYFYLGLMVAGMTAGAVALLRNIQKRWTKRPI